MAAGPDHLYALSRERDGEDLDASLYVLDRDDGEVVQRFDGASPRCGFAAADGRLFQYRHRGLRGWR